MFKKIKYFIHPVLEYFSFSKPERTILYFLIFAIILISFLNFFTPFIRLKVNSNPELFKNEIAELSLLKSTGTDSLPENFDPYPEDIGQKHYEAFFFDPNKIGLNEWIRLGVPQYVAERIEKYKSKGGKIRKPEDLIKFCGYDRQWYENLKDYVRIENSENKSKTYNKPPDDRIFDLNKVSREELISIKGIGDILSERIINYRESLGGYYSVEQLKEVYGIDSVKFNDLKKYFTVTNQVLRKLSLNLSNFTEFSKHPYLTYQQARKIIEYRNKYGAFKSVQEIRNTGIFTDTSLYQKLIPYLKLWDDDKLSD